MSPFARRDAVESDSKDNIPGDERRQHCETCCGAIGNVAKSRWEKEGRTEAGGTAFTNPGNHFGAIKVNPLIRFKEHLLVRLVEPKNGASS